MPISRLQHVNIRCADAEAAREFYSRVLGLTSGRRPPFESSGFWMYLGSEPIVHLVQRPHGESAKTGSGNLDHVAFSGVSLEATRAALDELGVRYQERLEPREGIVQIFVHDPDGIKVELNFTKESGSN